MKPCSIRDSSPARQVAQAVKEREDRFKALSDCMSTQLWCYWGFSKRQWGRSVGHTSRSNGTSGSWCPSPGSLPCGCGPTPEATSPHISSRSIPSCTNGCWKCVWRSSQTIKINLSRYCYLPSVGSLPGPLSACQALMAKSLGMSCSNKTYWDGLELNFCPNQSTSKEIMDVCQGGHWDHSLG